MTERVWVVVSWSLGDRRLHVRDDCPALEGRNTRAADRSKFPNAKECERCSGGMDGRRGDQNLSYNNLLKEIDGTAIPRGELADAIKQEARE